MSVDQTHTPLLFCFAGPGGSGKSTICSKLVEQDDSLMPSVSTTTRAPRDGEVDGVHYHFVSREEFEKRIAAGRFLEHAIFGENRYGTEKINVEAAAEKRMDCILDIEVQGVDQVRTLFPQQTVVAFVFPPTFSVLAERMRGRGTDDEARIAQRIELAEQEVARLRQPTFSDYLLLNDKLDDAVAMARSLIAAERMRLWRKSDQFLDSILKQ